MDVNVLRVPAKTVNADMREICNIKQDAVGQVLSLRQGFGVEVTLPYGILLNSYRFFKIAFFSMGQFFYY